MDLDKRIKMFEEHLEGLKNGTVAPPRCMCGGCDTKLDAIATTEQIIQGLKERKAKRDAQNS